MIISMPDRRTSDGWRDHALLLFLYNRGARVARRRDCNGTTCVWWRRGRFGCVARARRNAYCRCGRRTANALHRLRSMTHGTDPHCVFSNRRGQPLTRDGIAYVLAKHAAAAAQ